MLVTQAQALPVCSTINSNVGHTSSCQCSPVIIDKVGQMPDAALVAVPEGMPEFDHSGAQHSLGVAGVRQIFNKVPVGSSGQFKNVSDCDIPRGKDLLDFWRVQIPEIAAIEGGGIDSKESDHDSTIHITELLKKGIDLANKYSPLRQTVSSHGVITLKNITKVF